MHPVNVSDQHIGSSRTEHNQKGKAESQAMGSFFACRDTREAECEGYKATVSVSGFARTRNSTTVRL